MFVGLHWVEEVAARPNVQSNLQWHSDNCCQEKDKIQESFAKEGKTVQVKLDKAHAVFRFVFLKQKRFTIIFVCTHCHCLHYLLH